MNNIVRKFIRWYFISTAIKTIIQATELQEEITRSMLLYPKYTQLLEYRYKILYLAILQFKIQLYRTLFKI